MAAAASARTQAAHPARQPCVGGVQIGVRPDGAAEPKLTALTDAPAAIGTPISRARLTSILTPESTKRRGRRRSEQP